MNKKGLLGQAWFYLIVGIWVLIFGIIPYAILGGFQFGLTHLLSSNNIGLTLIIMFAGLFFVLYLIIGGWAAWMGVKRVKG